jgi:SAM-dependent methyltransferase
MCGPDSGGAVARYWDENREKAKDPGYWMAHPLCRQEINRRVSGNPHEWPLDWFKRVHAARPFERGVSWGCGLGAFERAAIRTGIVRAMDAFDISPKSLEDARREAEKEGISGIEYGIGDFDDPRLGDGRYDIVFFHASLHHVRRLGRLFRALRRALGPGGAVYVDEYVGPSRSEWTRERLEKAQRHLETVPDAARLDARIALPIERNDPSEAIRSGEIVSYLRQHFELAEWRPYGGQLAALVFPSVAREWTESQEGLSWVKRTMELEDGELRADPASTFYLVACGRLRPEPEKITAAQRVGRLRGRLRAEFPKTPRDA